jgi:hypothetical protein
MSVPVADTLVALAERFERHEKRCTEQVPQPSQIHWRLLQSERPDRPQGTLGARIAICPRVGAVLLGLEQQVGHLP